MFEKMTAMSYPVFQRIKLLILLLLMISITSCMSVSKYVARADMDSSPVPADYNPKKHIILVAEMPRLNNPEQPNAAITRKLDDAMKKYCPYPYEIVSVNDIYENKTKYGDTGIYKYAMLSSLNSVRRTTTTTITRTENGRKTTHSVSPSARTTYIGFKFYDRVNDKDFPRQRNASTHLDYSIAVFMAVIKKAKE